MQKLDPETKALTSSISKLLGECNQIGTCPPQVCNHWSDFRQ